MTPDELREAVARAITEAACLPEDVWRSSLPEADSALAAIREAGFVIVPVEPTPAMVIAGGLAWADAAERLKSVDHTMVDLAAACWQAMVKEAQALQRRRREP
jgi:hypothetical protein